jgi:hypothetical protein
VEVFVDGGSGGVVVGGSVEGETMGDVVQAIGPSIPDAWATGTVATVAPLWSIPTTDTPVKSALPVMTSTTMPEIGVIVSTSVPPDDRLTDATPLPTITATQPTGAPSWVPKEPTPRISTAPGDGAADGRDTESLPTALLVDNSTTSCSHPATGWERTVLVVVDSEEFVGKVSAVPPAEPEDAVPPAPALPLLVVPLCVCGVTEGSTHIAPCGHAVDPGGLVTGAQGADCSQLPVMSSSVK